MASFAARSALRSAGRVASGARLAAGASKTKPPSSPFRIPKQTQSRPSGGPTSFRSAMETSRCLVSILPYHSATASALLTSMLSLSNPILASTPEG